MTLADRDNDGMIGDMPLWLQIALPIASALISLFVTYWINVRVRTRTRFEDAIHDAIAATALVVAASDLVVHDAGWPGATDTQLKELDSKLGMHSTLVWLTAVVDARAAIKRASTLEPSLENLIRSSPRAFTRDAEAAIKELMAKLDSQRRERWAIRRHRSADH